MFSVRGNHPLNAARANSYAVLPPTARPASHDRKRRGYNATDMRQTPLQHNLLAAPLPRLSSSHQYRVQRIPRSERRSQHSTGHLVHRLARTMQVHDSTPILRSAMSIASSKVAGLEVPPGACSDQTRPIDSWLGAG